MKAIVEFERRINEPPKGIAAQVDVAQQILVEQGAGEIGKGASALHLVSVQRRDGLGVFGIDDNKTGCSWAGEIGKEVKESS